MKVRKEIIRSGDHTYIDENGVPRVLNATKDKIDHYFANGVEMLKAGIPIPIPLEHQPTATPMNAMDRAANRVRHNTGEVAGFERDVIKDPKTGNDIHRVMSVLDIKDDEIARKVESGSIRWVSPHITSFVDGKGKQWDDVIAHVALTSRPRIHDQQSFESVAMSFSQAVPGAKLLKKGIDLHRAGRLRSDGKPEYPIAFSLLTHGKKFDIEDMKKAPKKSVPVEGDDSDDDDFEEGTPGDDAAEMETEATDSDDGGDPAAAAMAGEIPGNDAGDVSFEELIPHLLEMHGIHVPAGGKGKEFLKALVQGLLTSAKVMASSDGGADDSVLGDAPADPSAMPEKKPQGPLVQESPPMMMSLETINKIKDPEKKALASMVFSLNQKVEANRNGKISDATTKRNARIERIAKLVSPKNRDKIMQFASTKAASLSLDAEDKIVDPMSTMLDIFEEELRSMPTLMRVGSDSKELSVEAHPSDEFLTDEQAEAMVDRQMRTKKTA